MEMRGFCVQYSKRKNRERRNIKKDLSDQIDALMKALATNRSKEDNSRPMLGKYWPQRWPNLLTCYKICLKN